MYIDLLYKLLIDINKEMNMDLDLKYYMNQIEKLHDKGNKKINKRAESIINERTYKGIELRVAKDQMNLIDTEKSKRGWSLEGKRVGFEKLENEDMDYYNSLDRFRGKMFLNNKIASRFKLKIERVKNLIISGNTSEISQLINIESLSKALKIIRKGGMKELTWSYKRQLRQFSIEVIRQFSK